MTALLLWSVAIVPAATVSYMASAEMAHAKSENAGGKGGGKSGNSGKSSNAGGKSKASAETSRSTGGGGKSATRAKGNDPVGRVLDRVLGRDKKQTVRTKRTTTVKRKAAPAKRSTVVARSESPKARPTKGPMHASNLGNMNGALNANVNAVLAHIKNGNTNGPVGHLAALAVANVNAEGAQEVIDLKEDFTDLQTALSGTPYETVAEYYEALDGVEPIINEDIDAAVAAIGDANTSQQALETALAGTPYATQEDYREAVENGDFEAVPAVDDAIADYSDPSVAQDNLDTVLADNGYVGETALADYESDREGVEGIEEITEVSDAIDVLGGDAETRADIIETEPSDEAVADAEGDIAAQDGAEVAILDYWNKNEDIDPAISEEEQALLDKLNERLDADAAAIAAAVGTEEPEVIEDEADGEITTCEDDTSCDPLDDEEIAVIVE